VVFAGGYQAWYVDGQRHRTDGAAVISADGTQQWYQNDQLHRTEGPAVVLADGTQAWFFNGKDITKAVEKWLLDRAVSWPFSDEETRVEFLLTWTT